eukprot:TRINITY_DN25893_c0_g1_i2.p1 TRINITY_DN25893_c0_g1~~TRINITY_DN25893_c0_g1_i2.p1  ORF type:complete len:833 (+),score=164.11 TRINITY_DN25893_c0_g1_i2:67-2565(+)
MVERLLPGHVASVYTDDRHCLFSSRSDGPLPLLAKRVAALPVLDCKPSAGKVKSVQAIVILCSGGGANPEGLPVAKTARFGSSGADSASNAAERWCSWADAKPVPREKLVEEQLERTHREYTRLFQHHGGAQKAPGGKGTGKAAASSCRACFDPSAEHLLTAVAATRRLTSSSGRVVLHYMHHRAPSSSALREEGRLLLHCQDTNMERPISLHSVHEQLRSPAIYIFDCPHAGRLVNALNGLLNASDDVVALGTCGEAELLPWEPLGLPSDLFTACLMSPVKAALSYYRWSGSAVLSEKPLAALGLVTGKPQDRATPLGELVSVFTAVTDAIAWSSLPPRLFWRLFREDGTLAELCRNFLLAGRILHTFGLNATSRPPLPPTHCHQLWDVWDSTLELFLLRLAQSQNPSPSQGLRPCAFFDDQMAAFAVWLRFCQPPKASGAPGEEPNWEAPAELPVMLQGLLHPSCRLQALNLLACFVDLGAWAAQLTLLVGARPYLTKLLSHDDGDGQFDVAGLALVTWTKILVADGGVEGLAGKDTYKSFFRLILCEQLSDYHRALGCACLAVACRSRPATQLGLLQQGVLEFVAGVLKDKSSERAPVFKWMAALLCGEVCRGCSQAAHEALEGCAADALVSALGDASPEVRASSVYTIGCILSGASAPATVDGASEPPRSILSASPSAMAELSSDPASATGASSARCAWLARITMWSFCRDAEAAKSQAPPPYGSVPLLDCTFLNEASALVRHELLCTFKKEQRRENFEVSSGLPYLSSISQSRWEVAIAGDMQERQPTTVHLQLKSYLFKSLHLLNVYRRCTHTRVCVSIQAQLYAV